jgi:CheY-like chemotaxis protein
MVDLQMPQMDGKTFIREIEKIHPENQKRPNVIIITGKLKKPEEGLQNLQSIVEIVKKPFTLKEIYSAIDRALSTP